MPQWGCFWFLSDEGLVCIVSSGFWLYKSKAAMDGRRHSVDIPISKTLVALRRVRSLRDPSTNGISTLSPLIDDGDWENGSSNGVSLRFLNASHGCDCDGNGFLRSNSLDFKGQREQDTAEFELDRLNCEMNYCGISCQEGQQDDGLVYSNPKQHGISGNKSPNESCCSNHEGRILDLVSVAPPCNHLKDWDSCYLSTAIRVDHSKSARKSLRKNQVKPSEVIDDIASHVGSQQCLSVRDALSAHSASEHITQDVDVFDNHNGCGIRCCWSKSPRFRESNHYSEIEGLPLILQHVNEKDLNGHRSMRHIGGEISPTLETPRSLSMKFRPKSFSDLVGQNVIGKSLLGAISRERISSFYLFHGPRGTGKTSASRIFAAALNCLSPVEQKPCGLCRECVLFFSGRRKNVKEVDSLRINRTDKVKSLVKNACIPPVSARFKVFIIDECQLLHGETWASLLNSLENVSPHVVFVMISPDLDKLPRSAVSRAQRYHFAKIKDADIASRLEKICVEEGLESEQVALDFIAARSCGSLRDAETMLDQLSLLGKRITISLVHELTGVISDDELLDLLDLALSSDTSNTVIRARELVRTRIDPLQLISQLANLIMDILAGKCELGGSEIRRRFCDRYTSEADLQKLSHALRILSETEKQLKISKNQTTCFTAALLQLSSVEYSSADANDTKLCTRAASNRDGDICSTSPKGDSLEHLTTTGQCDDKSYRLGVQEDHRGTLDSIWYKATEMCQSSRLKTFLRKQGKLSSVCINQGGAVAELEFHHLDYVSRAEKSWRLIASSLQFILGCNLELRINYVPSCTSDSKYAKLKRSSFNFFNCSRRIRWKSLSSNDQGSESDYADYTSQKLMMKDQSLICSSGCTSQVPPFESYHGIQVVTTLRSSEGNLLSSGKMFLNRSGQETARISCSRADSLKEEGRNYEHLASSTLDLDNQSDCFPRTRWLRKKFCSSYASHQKDLVLPINKFKCSETYRYDLERCVFSHSSNNCTESAEENYLIASRYLRLGSYVGPNTTSNFLGVGLYDGGSTMFDDKSTLNYIFNMTKASFRSPTYVKTHLLLLLQKHNLGCTSRNHFLAMTWAIANNEKYYTIEECSKQTPHEIVVDITLAICTYLG
ncbi:STICHEL 2 protein [Spatholobus suberectus]|nr:STICHEL 2 protein [Spatholobus suberectus]